MLNIYFVGAPTKEKGLDDFNEISSYVDKAKFYWYCFNIKTDLVKKYKYINFVKGLNDAELKKDIINKMSLFICCSHYEGFCLPIAEAMRLKIPVISYALDEIKSEFGDNIEYVDNKEQFKQRINSYILNNDYSKDLSLAREFIQKNYSPSKVVSRLIKIIRINL